MAATANINFPKFTLSFGKIPFNGIRRVNAVTVDISIQEGCLYMTCDVWNSKMTDVVMQGQCFDRIKVLAVESEHRPLFKQVVAMWKRWNANDSRLGNQEQMDCLRKYNMQDRPFSEQVEHLKRYDLHEVDGECFGDCLHKESLTSEVVNTISKWRTEFTTEASASTT